MSSGEGLIWAVRDPIERQQPIKEHGRVVDYQTVIEDPGVEDKRLLVIESEFASTLRVMARDGNTLSPTIRQAWESKDLRVLTKNSPARSTGAHISVVGHITPEELRRYLDRTEAANGFLNRFVLLCVRRSKYLPDGEQVDPKILSTITETLQAALRFAGTVQRLERDAEARELWHDVYPNLADGPPGLLGAATSRGVAHVMRLACLFALIDRLPLVKRVHLEAALAVWDYAAASAAFVFGDALGDPDADELLRALRASPDGITRTEIRDHFGRHRKGEQISRILRKLQASGLITRLMEETNGRPAERWVATKATKAKDSLTLRSHKSLLSPPASGPDSAAPHGLDREPAAPKEKDGRDELAPQPRQSGNNGSATPHTSIVRPQLPPDQRGQRERLSL
jgi:hypothetical protein